MPRSAAQVIENNFVKGLVTEATGLNYPENSCVAAQNCEFDFFGRVARRLAFDFEEGSTISLISRTGNAIREYVWKNATGDGTTSFVVTQIGYFLHFYDVGNYPSLSGGLLVSTINLSTYASTLDFATVALKNCQFADGLAKLYVFHPYLNNIFITYSAGTFTATQYTLQIRDFEGVPSTAPVDQRPLSDRASLSVAQLYNLYNQGWIKADGSVPELAAWDTARADMPSNCDVWWNFKNATDVFDTATIANSGRGNTPAPKGHFVLSVYNQDRQSATGLLGAPSTTSGTARSSCGAFHAGRVFYSGINAAGFSSKIYFTQIIERDDQLGHCYQSNDPTSEDLFDLLPADGGIISIPDAGTIYKLFSSASGLLVFAYKGVWLISGSVGTGFTATDYTVVNISSIRTISDSSFVNVNGVPMWWNTDGIFTCQGGQVSPQVQSMSISTMQTFYNSIPNNSKLNAVGAFNPLTQTVQWVYRSTEAANGDDQWNFNAVLNFNVLTSAFFPWTISDGVSVNGIIVVDGFGGGNTSASPRTKFLCSFTQDSVNYFTWAETISTSYFDWSAHGLNIDYGSYFITGPKTHGQAQMKFQPTYVYVYNEGLGQAYIQGVWDFSTTPNTGRYSTKQRLIYDDDTVSTDHRRVKLRGQGLTLQYYVTSIPGQAFNMVGWSTFETGNQAV